MEERIKCKKCGTSILLQTAGRNEGLCKPCHYQATGAKPVKQVKASSLQKRVGRIEHAKHAYGCDQCRAVKIGGWKSLDNRKCPTCSREMKEMELVEVVNKARLAYLGIWISLAAICFILFLILKPSGDWERSSAVVLLPFGVLSLLFPLSYLFMVVGGRIFVGFGGWRWLTRKVELKSPPSWFQAQTFRQALLRESFVSLGILILVLIVGLIMGLVKG